MGKVGSRLTTRPMGDNEEVAVSQTIARLRASRFRGQARRGLAAGAIRRRREESPNSVGQCAG